MILKQDTLIQQEGDSFGEVFETKINKNKLSKLYSILSNLYRDVEGSIVREYSSNMWDSHKEAGKENEPIFIELHEEYENNYISFKDVGLGMSPETMRKIYFNYLDSTKEESNELTGAFGIGSKSALAYTHTFYIDTIWNGILYHYIFSKKSDGTPAGELLFEESTEECNGTTIKIPIKSRNDVNTFANAIKRQMIYFPNIYVKSNYYGIYDSINDFVLYEDDLFIYRPDLDITSQMHICLGNVFYQINWQELGMNYINIPIGLKFAIGELTPTPSREDIVYSVESIQLIKNRIQEVLDKFTNDYNSTVTDIKTLGEYEKVVSNDRNIYINLSKEVKLAIGKSYLPNLKSPKFIDSDLDPEHVYKNRYMDWKLQGQYIAETGRKRQHNNTYYYNSTSNGDMENIRDWWKVLIANNGSSDFTKNLYLGTEGDHYLVNSVPGNLKRYKQWLSLGKDKSKWRKLITDFQKITNEYVNSKWKNYDDIVIDEDWLAEYKVEQKELREEARNRRKEDKTIVCYSPGSGHNKKYVWEKDEVKISDLCKFKGVTIYSDHKNRANLIELYELIQLLGYNRFTVISVAKSYHKHFENQDNMYTFEGFVASKHRKLKRIATAYKINQILDVPSFVRSPYFKYLNKAYQDEVFMFENYLKQNRHNYNTVDTAKEIYNLMKDLGCLEYNLIKEAEELQEVLKSLRNINENFKFLDDYYERNYNKPSLKYFKHAVILMKAEGLKVNKNLYLKEEYNEVYQKFKPVEEETNND